MKQPKSIQISIPRPCTQDWSKMTPQQQGRFCDSCQKCVVDFTGFTDEQLYQFFAEHRGKKVCGRIRKTQLNRAINIPHQPHSTLYKWIMAAGIALVLVVAPKTGAFAQVPHKQEQVIVSENKTQTGRVNGNVYNVGQKNVAGVQVTIFNDNIKYRDTTDENGKYSFENIAAGNYTIEAYVKNGGRGIVYNVPITSTSAYVDVELSTEERGSAPTVKQYEPLPILEVQLMGGISTTEVQKDNMLDHLHYRNVEDIILLTPGVLPAR